MKEYDIAFSLGFSCGTSQALRAAGLQFASYPLDWVGIPDIEAGIAPIINDFEHWMDKDDMEFDNECHTVGFMTRFYLNRRTRLYFTHEFNAAKPFAETYPIVYNTYMRRIERFIGLLKSAKRILAVWVEAPTHACPDISRFRAALSSLRTKYPHAAIDLLVFAETPHCAKPTAVFKEDGLTVVEADYRQMDNGKVAHFVYTSPFARYLAENFRVTDTRTQEEKNSYKKLNSTVHSLRWGPDKSRFRRWINKQAYKTFRHIEGILLRKKLIHGDVSFWPWPDIRREAEGGGE